MLPTPENYTIYPRVMLADTPTEMVIVPAEKAFLFLKILPKVFFKTKPLLKIGKNPLAAVR